MSMRRILLLTALMFLLSGCGPVYETHYSYIPPRTWHGRECVNQCLTQRAFCRSQCATQKQACHAEADLEALPSYLSYEHQQRKSDNPDVETVSDFADYSACDTRCGCGSTYRACFSNCGGTVIANTICTAFCPKTAVGSLHRTE